MACLIKYCWKNVKIAIKTLLIQCSFGLIKEKLRNISSGRYIKRSAEWKSLPIGISLVPREDRYPGLLGASNRKRYNDIPESDNKTGEELMIDDWL